MVVTGACTAAGKPCTFTATLTDNARDGKGDSLYIDVPGVTSGGGALRSGNIVLHPPRGASKAR